MIARPHSLPVPLTPLLGREHEVAEIGGLLCQAEVRLLTLTGPGGVGKTRLALQVAADLRDQFTDGIFLVELVTLRDPGLVAATIAQTRGLHEAGHLSAQERLRADLAGKQVLLLLDNFEHLLAAAPLLADLLAHCPRLRVLVTSRAALRLRGEHEWPVRPLAVPDLVRLPAVEALAEYAAVTLFLQRAQAIQPSFKLSAQNAPLVAAICARLDGLPLALELAAARIKLLSPGALLARLEHRLSVLTGGAQDLPARQQTMRATIAWSYDLLHAGEQALFRRLAVFAGGATLTAVEAVCMSEGKALGGDVLDWLGSLLDKSLLWQQEGVEGESRLMMLETIREYGLEQLRATEEEERTQQRHATYYLALAETAELELTGDQQAVWLERVEQEHNNVRAVLRWAHDRGEQRMGLQVAGALWWFWHVRGYPSEGRRWLEALLVRDGAEAQVATVPALRAKALHAAGVLAGDQGDFARTRVLAEESLTLFRELRDKRGCAKSLNALGTASYNRGDYERATVLYEESMALYREVGDTRGIASLLANLGVMFQGQGDFARTTVLVEESLSLFRELGDTRNSAISLLNLGSVVYVQGDYARTRVLAEESLTLFRELGDKRGSAASLLNLGQVACAQGDYARAMVLHTESLILFRELGEKLGIAESLEGMVCVATAPGTAPAALERAAQLFGAAAALREAMDNPMPPNECEDFERTTAAIRATVGETVWAPASAAGRALTLEHAVSLALESEPSG